ncbi:hypothetical protein GCM10022205_28790 [Spinactinospora alkalitolerans]
MAMARRAPARGPSRRSGAASPSGAAISAITRFWPGRTTATSTAAASAVSAMEMISHVSPSTRRLMAVASPKTGTTMPSTA